MEKRNYVGSGKAISNQYGEMLNVSVNVAELQKFANEKGYARITITKRREPDQYGNTHSVIENTWKKKEENTEEVTPIDNFPF